MLQSYLENRSLGGTLYWVLWLIGCLSKKFMFISFSPVFFLFTDANPQASLSSQGFQLSREARAQADIKFTYVVSCQIYGQQKQRKEKEAADISLLLQRY